MSTEGITEQRKEHTARTIEAIATLKGAFELIEELKRENLILRMKLYTASS